MAIIKKINSNGSDATVVFMVNKLSAENAETLHLVGVFNDWDTQSLPMKKDKKGNFEISLELNPNQNHEFRYLKDNEIWLNDWEADAYVPSNVCEEENSLIVFN